MARAELISSFRHIFYHPHYIISVIITRRPAEPLRILLLPKPLYIRSRTFLHILIPIIHTLLIQ